MKRFNWWLIGLLAVCLTMVPLAGCVVSQSKFEALQAKYEALEADYQAISEELAGIYPLRNFNSRTELAEWRKGVGILDYTDIYRGCEKQEEIALYRGCEKLQEIALSDGYILLVNPFYEFYGFEIEHPFCLVTAGDSYYLLYPNTLGLRYLGEAVRD